MTRDISYPSPFIFIGSQEFEAPSGARLIPVYRTSDATLVLVSPELARIISQESIPPGTIDAEQEKILADARLICADQEEARREHYQKLAGAGRRQDSRTFVLLPTSYCNMGCDYCGQEHTKQALSGDHRSIILKRIQRAINNPGTKSVSVRWFGGEPLMAFAAIRQMSRALIDTAGAAGKEYHSNIVTNGALLDRRKLQVLVRECGISTFHITLDGPAEVHDTHRPLKSGQGSFRRLVSFLSEVTAAPEYRGTSFVLRTNVDVQNRDHISEYLRIMAASGFAGKPNVMFSMIAVHPWSNDVSALELNGVALDDLPGVEQVELDFPHDFGDAGLARFPGGEVAGFL